MTQHATQNDVGDGTSPSTIMTEGAAIDELSRALFIRLLESWERSARSQFECAKRTTDPMGKRLVEHGGICYYNCAADLRQALGVEMPQPSPNPTGH